MPFHTIDDVTYHITAQGTGPSLLLLHGFTGSGESWAAHLPDLTRQFRVLTVDLLGHGQTDAPVDPARYAMPQAAEDLARLLAAVTGEGVHLLGYSMGGRLALYMALAYPELVRSLWLESASPGLATEEERQARIRQDEALAQRIEAEGMQAFVDYWEGIPLFASQASLPGTVRDRLRRQRLTNRAVGLANSLRGMGTGSQPNLWPRLGKLTLPVHLLAGALDAKFVAINRQMAAAIPHATLTIAPAAGHTVHLERPEVWRRWVLDIGD